MKSSICAVCTISDIFVHIIVHIWSINYALRFGSIKIHTFCLCGKVFSTNINREIIFKLFATF